MREAVAAVVSKLNEWPYCVTVHMAMFASSGGDTEMLSEPTKLAPNIAGMHEWAAATLSPDSDIIGRPEIALDEAPQIFGTASMYHYINRLVSIFLTESPVALPGMMTTTDRKLVPDTQTDRTHRGKAVWLKK